MNKILIIAAHPDDEMLGCGATMARFLRAGAKLKILFLGEGSSCRFKDPESREARHAIQERNTAAVKSLSAIGISDYKFCNLPCGRFDQVPIIEINKLIEREIRDFQPNKLFTHSDSDSNNDHRVTFKATIMATRPCNGHIVNQVLSYEVLSSSEWCYGKSFSPNYFVEVTHNDLNKKWEALKCYGAEMRDYPFPRSYEGVINLGKQRGMQSGSNFAEAFKLIREFL
jgi:LmbE family N-acetylglucosaminyl deacetylase